MKSFYVAMVLFGLIGLITSGCIETKFIKTIGNNYQIEQRSQHPLVYTSSMPSEQFVTVGVIEASMSETDLSIPQMLQAIKEKGKEVGCDVLIDAQVYYLLKNNEMSYFPKEFGPLLAMVGPGIVTPYGGRKRNLKTVEREFICGIFQSEIKDSYAGKVISRTE